MPLKLIERLGIGAAMGGAEIVAMYADEYQGWTEPFKRSKDYLNLGAFVVGLADAGMEFSKGGWVGETLFIASEPLLIRSIYEALRHYVFKGGSKGGTKITSKKKGRWVLTERAGQAAPVVHGL